MDPDPITVTTSLMVSHHISQLLHPEPVQGAQQPETILQGGAAQFCTSLHPPVRSRKQRGGADPGAPFKESFLSNLSASQYGAQRCLEESDQKDKNVASKGVLPGCHFRTHKLEFQGPI